MLRSAPPAVDLAVIGAGASATLLLTALAEAGGMRSPAGGPGRVVVVDPAEVPGPGVPYRTPEPWHRMNVRARDLSAHPTDDDHFVRWLEATGNGVVGESGMAVGPLTFVPRRVFGAYLGAMWSRACAPDAGHDVSHCVDRAVAVRPHEGGVAVTVAGGDTLIARHVVLATGVPPTGPGRFSVDAGVPPDVIVADPWSQGALERIGSPPSDVGAARAVLVGTGLTAVDVALTLASAGWTVTAVSPVASFPARHIASPEPAQQPLPPPPDPATAASVTRWVRRACADEPAGWQAALDVVRHRIGDVWGSMTWTDRERLVRHAGPVWQSHRHRIAPEVGDRLDALIASGRVTVERGWVRAVGAGGGPGERGARVSVVVTDRRDGELGDARSVPADLVVNCAGPPPLRHVDDPLLATLVADGNARVDPLGWGVEAMGAGALVRDNGAPAPGVWLLGALRRGTELEATAIPDLRVQARSLAEALLADAGSLAAVD